MTRKAKTNVIDRVSRVLVECPLSADELKSLEAIERRRQEADSDMRVAITPDQKTRCYAKAARAGEEALALARRVAERIESKRSAEVMREIEQLAQLRGDDLEEVSTGARLRMSPLLKLHNARLISDEQFAAGHRYGSCWQRLYWDAKGNGTGNGDLDRLDSRLADIRKLDDARGYSVPDCNGKAVVASGLGGDARLISLVDAVCGAEVSLRQYVLGNASGTVIVRKRAGETDEQAKVRGSGHKREVAMDRLLIALNMLALHYGLYRSREDEQRAA